MTSIFYLLLYVQFYDDSLLVILCFFTNLKIKQIFLSLTSLHLFQSSWTLDFSFCFGFVFFFLSSILPPLYFGNHLRPNRKPLISGNATWQGLGFSVSVVKYITNDFNLPRPLIKQIKSQIKPSKFTACSWTRRVWDGGGSWNTLSTAWSFLSLRHLSYQKHFLKLSAEWPALFNPPSFW